MKNTIFDFHSYKIFLRDRLSGKGVKGSFSNFIGCQPSFLSQVLGGKPNLSLEQGVLANDFFAHSAGESRHFLLLLQHERAGSKRLREYFATEIEASAIDRRKISKRIAPAKELSQSARIIYYSSWVYGAVHVLSSLNRDDQLEFLSQAVGLQRRQLNEVIDFLAEQGLIRLADGAYRPSERRIHIPSSDPLVLGHHRNFRAKALEELKVRSEENLHYSMLMAISKADGDKIRDMILQFIETTDKVIRPSQEEHAFQLCLDFFEI